MLRLFRSREQTLSCVDFAHRVNQLPTSSFLYCYQYNTNLLYNMRANKRRYLAPRFFLSLNRFRRHYSRTRNASWRLAVDQTKQLQNTHQTGLIQQYSQSLHGTGETYPRQCHVPSRMRLLLKRTMAWADPTTHLLVTESSSAWPAIRRPFCGC